MNTALYYIAPTNQQFNELKAKAIDIWKTYDNTYGYVDEKLERIQDLKNISDNFMYMVSMFDMDNQVKLASLLNSDTRQAVADRIKSGGAPDKYNVFLI